MEAKIHVEVRVYWVHLSDYSTGHEYPTLEEAVSRARGVQAPFEWGGHSRQFVALRHSSRYAIPDSANGIDCELVRWEVFPDRLVLVEAGATFTDEAKAAALALPAPREGWACADATADLAKPRDHEYEYEAKGGKAPRVLAAWRERGGDDEPVEAVRAMDAELAELQVADAREGWR